MSYDLNLYVKSIDDSVIPTWIDQLKEFGIKAEIHPEFSFETDQGFLPFKVKLEGNNAAFQDELITGFELLISEIDREEIEELVDEGTELPNHLEQECKDLMISVHYLFRSIDQMDYYADPVEFQVAWASASILCSLLDGVLCNPQVGGGTYSASEAKNQAKAEIEKHHNSLKPTEWEFHKFEGWNL